MPKPTEKKKSSSSAAKTADERFANFGTDPRFRLPSGKSKTKLDSRFKKALKDKDFTETAKVDRYGRKLKSGAGKKALQRLYELDEEDEDEDEDNDDDEEDDELKLDDQAIRRELRRADENYDPARDGGFSESETDSDSEAESDGEGQDLAAIGDLQTLEPEKEEIPEGEVTNRLAVVNLDWDHVKSTDLMAMFTSFVPPGGSIEKISIYPSEFGKERMAREEAGPPKAIFKTSNTSPEDESDDSEGDEESEDDEEEDARIKKDLIKEGDDQDFNTTELRAYQLDRLRYYYAVMVCSDKATAKEISDATDGREFQASSNFLDLRFVPDDTTFDDTPRDECSSVPDNYKPIDFVTDALSHSKVKLTWDMHPEEASRKDSIKRAFTGDQKKMTEDDMDLHMYLASDNSDDDEEGGDDPALSKKEQARQKMREALGLGPEPVSKSAEKGPVGDLQITFTSALSGKGSKSKDPAEETTIEKYQRKEKERKQKRKQARAETADEPADAAAEAEGEDLGFDDPFFTTAPGAEPKETKTSVRKEERRKKRETREAEEVERAAEKKKLELLMVGEDGEEDVEHFDMKEIERSEKRSKKKRKDRKERADRGGLQEDFKMDVADPRFAAIYEDHEFAIDPSHAKFKKTPGMEKLLEEGRNKRKNKDRDEPEERRVAKEAKRTKTDEDELAGLVASVRRKAEEKKARAKGKA